MCRSCDQTPDGAGRRCPNRASGFTTHESDQRSRSRGLNAAQNALAQHNDQDAANALARAVAAQRSLDGVDQSIPQDQEGPQTAAPARDVYTAPSDMPRLRAELDNLNAARARDGLTPLDISITMQRAGHPTDPMLRRERVRVRLRGLPQAELDELTLMNTSDRSDEVMDGEAALAAAHAIARSTGGHRSKAEAGSQSTASMLSAYLADEPGGKLRQAIAITPEDSQAARDTIQWAREANPTSDYMRSVQGVLSNDTITHRNLALAVSAMPVAERQRAREARAAAPQPQAMGQAHSSAPVKPVKRSVWIGHEGQYAHTTGVIEDIQETWPHPDAKKPNYLYRIRTDGGASVKFWLSTPYNCWPGDRITIAGIIDRHEEYEGYKSTVFTRCVAPIMHAS